MPIDYRPVFEIMTDYVDDIHLNEVLTLYNMIIKSVSFKLNYNLGLKIILFPVQC